MSTEEKQAWIMGVVAAVSYTIYLVIILRRAEAIPLVEVPYRLTMIWTIVWAIVATIVLSILAAMVSPKGANKKDQRDREIYRRGFQSW